MDATRNSTRISLLHRLKNVPDDQDSWVEFVNCYQPMIHRWCAGFGLQDADAHDVTQNVLLKIAQHIRKFERRPSGRFRSWLKTVVHNAWRDFVKSQKEKGAGDQNVTEMLLSVKAADDLLKRIDEEYDQQLLMEAMRVVKSRVEPQVWQAFEMLAISHLPTEAVASRLGITKANAYVSKNRVKKMLAEEVANFESADLL